MITQINDKYANIQCDDVDEDLLLAEYEAHEVITSFETRKSPDSIKCDADNKMLARIIARVLGQRTVSATSICEHKPFQVGWRKAREFLEKLQQMGIVGALCEKLPCKVLITVFEELSEDVIAFLTSHGYTEEQIRQTFEPDAKE